MNKFYDLLARFAAVAFCVFVLSRLIQNVPTTPLALASRVSVMAFVLISLVLFAFRRRAVAKSSGLYVRLVAFVGAFLMMTIPLTSKPFRHEGVLVAGTTLAFVGNTLSVIAIFSLGRSFSIMAEARKLVTSGMYRICRHPLYLSEGIATVGVVALYLSPISLLTFVVFTILQYRRIKKEEEILQSVFPEYKNYKATTPMLIPRL